MAVTAIPIVAILISTAVCVIVAYPDYVNYIPNGDRIPDPCDRTKIWTAVGHRNPEGMGRTTPFGHDFPGHWTRKICEQDSDGDGRTNGEELGDPDCVWEPSSEPAITDPAKLSHPGVCEPLDAPFCKDKNLFLAEECLRRFPTKNEL